MKTKLIGHAGELAGLLTLTLSKQDRCKVLLGGRPGIGKSEAARQIAHDLCGGKWGVEEIIGRKCSVHHIYQYEEEFASSCLYGTGRKVRIINEIDTMPRDALDAVLALLDDMPAGRGIIGTTNLPFGELTERFRTRFTRYTVKPPKDGEICGLLVAEGVPIAVAGQIAALAGGNVRAALLDAEAWRNTRPEPSAPMVMQGTLASLGI